MMNDRYKMDAEIEMYLKDLLALTWNLSLEYAKGNKDSWKVKQYWAKVNNNKYKIAKRINQLKTEISILKIGKNDEK